MSPNRFVAIAVVAGSLCVVTCNVGPVRAQAVAPSATTVPQAPSNAVSPVVPDASPVASQGPQLPAQDAAQIKSTIDLLARVHAQQLLVQKDTRVQMLGALSPAHRSVVATLIGQSLITASPDPTALAGQISAALSVPERQGIVAVSANARRQMQTLGAQVQAEFERRMPPADRAAMQEHAVSMPPDMAQRLTPDQRREVEQRLKSGPMMVPPLSMSGRPPNNEDAGMLLLRTLVAPMMPFELSGSFGTSGMGGMIMQVTPLQP